MIINGLKNIKEKLEFFRQRGEPIHFNLIDKGFRNGYIKDIKTNSFILDELVMGELFIHFDEIMPTSISICLSKKLQKSNKSNKLKESYISSTKT